MVFSITIYIVLKWILPAIQVDNIILKGIAQALPDMSGYIAFIFLIPAPISAFNSWRKKQLLDKQKGIESIRALSWKEFEELVAEAFRRKGYSVIENSGTGPDGGVDVVLKRNGNLFLVQCKQWKAQKVGVRIVREMYGVMVAKHAAGVIIITSGFFTRESQSFAKDKSIELIDGQQLSVLIAGVKTNSVEEKAETHDSCPRCGNQLVLRTARRGKNAGNKFWACPGFPKCKFTKPYQS